MNAVSQNKQILDDLANDFYDEINGRPTHTLENTPSAIRDNKSTSLPAIPNL